MAGRFFILSDARTGSTYLTSLLNQHYKIRFIDEPLNNGNLEDKDVIQHVGSELSEAKKPVVGFKMTPEQMRQHNLRVADVVRPWKVDYVIVLWREGSLESYVSLLIANNTGKWYSDKAPERIERVKVGPGRFNSYLESLELDWREAVRGWPVDVVPIFVKYEDLTKDVDGVMRRVLLRMSLDPESYTFETEMKRQNPASLQEKISNFDDLEPGLVNRSLDVPEIVNSAIEEVMNIPKSKMHVVPDREPPVPPSGWRYRVCEPYLTGSARQNVLDAIDSTCISSAGYWPRKLASMLKELYNVPVAAPCSNGFGALVLAMQAAGIGNNDEVIIPSFTMIAVSNAVRFVSAKPVLVDNAKNEYNPGLREILDAATERTKAVIVSHTYGVPTSDMEALSKLCTERGWVLIEDISEAAGILVESSTGERLLGTFGDFACASMYANKILQGGDAGFILAKDIRHGTRLGSLVNHGFTRSYHFVHFEEAANFKICGLAAAVACSSIESKQYILDHRTMLARTYRRELSKAPLTLMPDCGPHDTPWVFGVVCASKEERQGVREHLARKGIETRNYFFPIHLQPAYSFLEMQNSDRFTTAEYLAETGFYLPTSTGLTGRDIIYISKTVVQYFTNDTTTIQCPEELPSLRIIRLVPETLTMQIRQFENDGSLHSTSSECLTLRSAVNLRSAADRYLWNEKYDTGRNLVNWFKDCCEEAEKDGYQEPREICQPFIDYIQSQSGFEQEVVVPWSNENLNSDEYKICSSIPTTTETSTIQMLCWLIKEHSRKTVLELGSWFGSCTSYMAVAARHNGEGSRIFAADAFTWMTWMNKFEKSYHLKDGDSFFEIFQRNISPVSDVVHPVRWNMTADPLPEALQDLRADLIFIDFTRQADDLEKVWEKVKPLLIESDSIVVINGLTLQSISFIVNHKDELHPIGKPYESRCKAFRYDPNTKNDKLSLCPASECPSLPRKLKFLNIPNWNHHHRNSFYQTIKTLRERLHSDDADVDFIPAVEEFLCDNEMKFTRPWVGIIHGVSRDDVFYPPDMERLCTARYDQAMQYCQGLFTLTKFQADYLEKHLPKHLHIPICPVHLAISSTNAPASSCFNENWLQGGKVDLVFVGSFARNYEYFYDVKVPSFMRKVLLAGDSGSLQKAKNAPSDVRVQERLDDDGYDKMLRSSVVFLALKYTGAANTVVLECIERNTPIVAPRIDSCVEYLGEKYPLFYETDEPNLTTILSKENVESARKYLEEMDKGRLSVSSFCRAIAGSSVLLALPPHDNKPTNKLLKKHDVTICICSYKRTHNLENILRSLLMEQDFEGSMKVIVWNNNDARKGEVRKICQPFLVNSNEQRSLEVITSTCNHYCIIRLCMTPLMQSDALMICDDDVVPQKEFVSFFMDAHSKHVDDVLCVRGHLFLQHELDSLDPTKFWTNYEHLKFINDDRDEQFINFVHADACLLPRAALRELCSVEMPDNSFVLVDDYWMSFVLSHHFGRKLRKLKCSDKHLLRTPDSDQPGLALYTRPEVEDAKVRMYIYHMLHGWPTWNNLEISNKTELVATANVTNPLIKEAKLKPWRTVFIGFNVPSTLTEADGKALKDLGVTVVRIGAVGCKEAQYELSEFLINPTACLAKLLKTISMLAKFDINVVLTLQRRIASVEIWKIIAKQCRHLPNVIGYDLINEPYLEDDKDLHHTEVSTSEISSDKFFSTVRSIISEVRSIDKDTTIIIEPTFWANYRALDRLSDFAFTMNNQYENIVVSIHFYDPRRLTSRSQNEGRYSFPGSIPAYTCAYSEEETWNEKKISEIFQQIYDWQQSHGIKVFVGEFGIVRETRGAAEYLAAVGEASVKFGISSCAYSFREETWDAMDYELGPTVAEPISRDRLPLSENPLMSSLVNCIEKTKTKNKYRQ